MRLNLNWGHGITAVYICFAVATLSFVVFAMRHPAELVSSDYYAKSLEHDRRQAATARGVGVGERVGGRVSDDGQGLIITLPVAEGPATITGEARLYRASSAKDDRAWSLVLDRDGHQTLPTQGLPAGRWTLQLDWRRDGLDFYAERPVLLP